MSVEKLGGAWYIPSHLLGVNLPGGRLLFVTKTVQYLSEILPYISDKIFQAASVFLFVTLFVPKQYCAGLTLDGVRRVVAYWQKQFRLTDWKLTTKLVDPRTLPDNSAEIEYCNLRRKAVISVAWDADNLEDLHDSVIHELLHLFWSHIPRDSWQVTFEEQTIHSIAPVVAALFMAARAKDVPVTMFIPEAK